MRIYFPNEVSVKVPLYTVTVYCSFEFMCESIQTALYIVSYFLFMVWCIVVVGGLRRQLYKINLLCNLKVLLL